MTASEASWLTVAMVGAIAEDEGGRVLRTELSSLRTKLLRILAFGFNLSRNDGV